MTKILTEEQRLSKAHVGLMSNLDTVAFSGVLMFGESSISDEIPTAGTNGKDTLYGREFVRNLTDPQLRAVVLHENLHKMYRHFLTWKPLYDKGIYAVSKNDATGEEIKCNLANVAADLVINLQIKDIQTATSGFVELPPHACVDEKYRDMDTGQVFRQICLENPPQQNGGGGGDGGGEGDNDCKMPGSGRGQFDEHDWEHGAGMTDQQKADLSAAIDGAIRQGAILAGKAKGNVPRGFDELMEAQVRWEDQLRDFVMETCKGSDMSTFRRPNRRHLQHDIYMPTSISETLQSLMGAIDTSGSIYGAVLNAFVSEFAAAVRSVNPDRTDLVYWDTQVAGHETYGKDEADLLISSTKPKGGGGTSPGCVGKYINDNNIKPQCVIFLTDGFVGNDWSDQGDSRISCPVLWVIVDNPGVTAPNGSTIHISSEQYKN